MQDAWTMYTFPPRRSYVYAGSLRTEKYALFKQCVEFY